MNIDTTDFYSYSLNDIMKISDFKLQKIILQLYYAEIEKIKKDPIGKLFINDYESLEEISFNIDQYLQSITSEYLFPNHVVNFYPTVKELKARKTIQCDFSSSLIFKNSHYYLYRPLLQDLNNGKRYVLKRSIKVEIGYDEYLPKTFTDFEQFIYKLDNSYSLHTSDKQVDYYTIARNIKDWSLLELKSKRSKIYIKK